MARIQRAFTLIELLVVLAVISILAGILFPVFASVKHASLKATCISNYKQITMAAGLYVEDYDDRYMPVNHQPAAEPNSRNDRTWVQLVLPYVRTFKVFQCPADFSDRPKPEATFDQDLVPGETYSQYYTASLRSNVAYNFLYLSPIIRSGEAWTATPKSTTDVTSPSTTVFFVDSVWSRDKVGNPIGGGSWLVVPPCRYSTVNGHRVDTFASATFKESTVYVPEMSEGWTIAEPDSPTVYGNAWPWHFGRMTVAYTDGSVSSLTPNQLSTGCTVAEKWQGTIESSETYLWDLR